MTWTTDQKLESLLRLPWTISSETTPEGDRLLRVAEIPSAVGSGTDDLEVESDLWESLRAFLAAYLHFDDEIPLPEGCDLPWSIADRRNEAPKVALIVRQRRDSLEQPLDEVEPTGAASDWESPDLVAA